MLRRANSSMDFSSALSVNTTPFTVPNIPKLSPGTCSKAHSSSSVSSPIPSIRSYRHSEAPLCCTSSTSGSKNKRSLSSVGVCGSLNMSPPARFELCGIANTSHRPRASVHSRLRPRQRSGKLKRPVSYVVIGRSITSSFLKMTLRCMFCRCGLSVYSYPTNVVNAQVSLRS